MKEQLERIKTKLEELKRLDKGFTLFGSSKHQYTVNPTSVNDWDWKEVQATSKKLKQYIHGKLSEKRLGGIDILPGASKLQEQGIELR